MTKLELVGAVADRLETSRAGAAELVDLFFGSDGLIAAELKRGGQVKISGFGLFQTRKRVGRTVRNPRTGRRMRVRSSIVPVFRAGKTLKTAVARTRR